MIQERFRTARQIVLEAMNHPLMSGLARRLTLLTTLYILASCPNPVQGKTADPKEIIDAPTNYITVQEDANIQYADHPRTVLYTTKIQSARGNTLSITDISYAVSTRPRKDMLTLGYDLEKIH